ncbi:MAG: DUF3806 domain-containing protein [Halioglobus sp.]|nr:DUF3806 domain-containing protein [Halioglobus sp.]
MSAYWPRGRALLALCLLVATLGAAAQDEPRVGELSYLDRQFMSQQRALVQEMAASNLGRQFNGSRDNDLELLQLLLDRRLVRPEQTRELQAMGVILGDLLAQELDMHWVVYEDQVGRSRALRYRDSDNYLFPITMISRRREVDNRTPVQDIYHKARASIASSRPALPFQ